MVNFSFSSFLIVLVIGVIGLQNRQLTSAPVSLEPAQQRLSVINSAKTWEQLGFKNLASSLLWLDFVQFYGANIIRHPDLEAVRRRYHELSYAYLDTVTQLDPRFIQPYLTALNAVGWKQGNPDLARLLMIRGLLYANNFRDDELHLVPMIYVNLGLVYLLFYASPEGVRFTFNQSAIWSEKTALKLGERVTTDPEQLRILGDRLADRIVNDPLYAKFLGWQQVYLGADDPEIIAIGRRELENIGATFALNEEGRVIPIPPPPAPGVNRIQLAF